MMTVDTQRVRSLVKALGQLGKPIVLGGVHPTVFPEDAITMADDVIVGEGYEALLQWCRSPQRTDIENLWVRQGDKIYRNPVRRAIPDIDVLPLPDYGPDNHWVIYKGRLVEMDARLLGKFMSRVYHQFASLGCPFSCSYCINNRFARMGQGYGGFRHHSVDHIIREAKHGMTLSPDIECIDFRDDGFIFLDENILAEFADKYRRQIGLPFNATGVIPAFLTERKLELLVSAGMKRTRLGFQSANKEALRFYRRSGNAEQYEKCNDMLQKHEEIVFPYYDIITDNVFVDPEKDAVDTIEFLLKLKGRFSILVYGLRIYPGTDLFEKARTMNLDRKYYDATYMEFSNNLLNYILTLIQCSHSKILPRLLLRLYRLIGNIPLPKTMFAINRMIWYARCAIEHFRKDEASALPNFVAALLHGSRRGQVANEPGIFSDTSSPAVARREG